MADFITLDAQGNIDGLYTDEPGYIPVPAGATLISAADSATLRRGPISDYQYQNGVLILKQVSLSDEKIASCLRIDAAAIAVDNKYLTCGGQQGQVYAQKMAQALAYKQASYPALADPMASTDPNYALYGYVRAERDAMRVSVPAALDKDAADTIIAQSNLYALSIGIQREALRRKGKEQVMAAAVSSAIAQAESAAITALRSL